MPARTWVRHQPSTFRLTLRSILAGPSRAYGVDEASLAAWVRECLRLLALPAADSDVLDSRETALLAAPDTP